MTAAFYKIFIGGPGGPHRALAAPTIDGRATTYPQMFRWHRPVEVTGQLATTVVAPGAALDISWTTSMNPVVTDAVKEVVESVTPGAVQWFPITVEGDPEPRWLMNILHEVDCLDEARTNGTRGPDGKWDVNGYIFIQPDFEPEHQIFGTKGWSAEIMTDKLKAELDAHGFQGIRYKDVS